MAAAIRSQQYNIADRIHRCADGCARGAHVRPGTQSFTAVPGRRSRWVSDQNGNHAGLAFTAGEPGAAGEMRSPAWSPDGKQVVYQKFSYVRRAQNLPLFNRDPDFELIYSEIAGAQ